MKYIHECGQHLDLEENGIYHCPNCGKQFEFQIPPQDQNICQYCKSPLPDGATKCAHCGEWLAPKQKSLFIYILLAILFGNWGIAEAYSGRIFLGLSYMILSFASLIYFGNFYPILIIWSIQMIVSLCIGPIKSPSR